LAATNSAAAFLCAARLEAVVDFGEEEGIDLAVAAGVLPLVRALRGELEGHLASAVSGELIRSGVRIAIVGCVGRREWLEWHLL
jgi:tRNA modification GTPase